MNWILAGITVSLLAAAPGPDAVPDQEFRRVVKEIRAMPETVDRTAVVMEAVGRRWISSTQAVTLLETIPAGCGRLEAAIFVQGRLVDPENFYRVYTLFPDVGDQQELKKHSKKVQIREEVRAVVDRTPAQAPPSAPAAARPAAESYVKIDVVDQEGNRVEEARIYVCGAGPEAAPLQTTIRDEPWISYGCELQVWVGKRMIYSEQFLPAPDKLFERRVRVDYY